MNRDFIDAITGACSCQSAELLGLFTIDEFNSAAYHASTLIDASFRLFASGHYPTSLFLSITAFEEIAKVKPASHRARLSHDALSKRREDPLFSHTQKHVIALDPVLLIGDRLAKSIGEKRINEIFNSASSLFEVREKCLYFSRNASGLKIPSAEINQRFAAEYLMVAIEMFVDEFWGVTNDLTPICREIDTLYNQVEAVLNNKDS